MNAVACATPVRTAHPRLHIASRPSVADDDTPPFFARFSRDGKILVLQTPTTEETYTAEPFTDD